MEDKLFDIKVLYVEDDPAARELTSMLLRRRVRELVVAENGREGLDAYLHEKPDLVITDIRMPEMDGLDMSREIKARNPNAKIVVTTAHNDTTYLISSIETGIDYYVLKPIELEKLMHAIGSCADTIHFRKKAEQYHEEREKLIRDLEEALKEKEMLIREVHHRVKNNLQVIEGLLTLQSFKVSDGKDRELFDESRIRVQAISKIHEMLYKSKDLKKIDFARYLRELVESLHENYSAGKPDITLTMDIPDITMDINVIIPCGLVVNELVSNALKHAFPGERKGEIFVGIERDGDASMSIVVRDNGIGIPDDFDITGTSTLGMQIIMSLSHQLGGGVVLNRRGGCEFRVPVKMN